MKKVQFTAALLALMLALGGCSGTTVGESQSAQSSQSITVGESQEEQDEQVLSAERGFQPSWREKGLCGPLAGLGQGDLAFTVSYGGGRYPFAPGRAGAEGQCGCRAGGFI